MLCELSFEQLCFSDLRSEIPGDEDGDCFGLHSVTSLTPARHGKTCADRTKDYDQEIHDEKLSLPEYKTRQLRALAHCIELLSNAKRPVVLAATGEELKL
ncbi:hypothetical protein GUITHDRAFT_119242 [Guillardia theta CCMP2712]|uniref:Uncharacterized protein n=1 Tax=Guillardia theta (strain CCMP2712) TaxID=905079 RepID=L1IES4_GUITC|nr:hypothetical protein GUITHDRAFT_119242 [Guillardia theta CCMP2712]EKX34592.1 hypothetical protein GUITHDRAFT_119242 [Guillardia theta CCMP2712]|eukprot:XP_005821572.1 hypothetical protein GUITHDRAFT_119242 [Guillardia theta CCMP2712]